MFDVRYCDGKVSLDVVAAATFLKDTLDKKGIQELLSNVSNYKDQMMQKLVSNGLDIEETSNSETPQPESASYTTDTKTLESDSLATDRETLQSETLESESADLNTDPKLPESDSSATDRKTPESEFGMDFRHWFVQMKLPDGELSRDEIINFYISTLASVVGSEEEARMKIYSVSTIHYYAFGALISEELSSKLKVLPQVLQVDPDCYLNKKNKDYGGEPFVNGQAVAYDPKYHASYWRMKRARIDPPEDKDADTKIPQPNRYSKQDMRKYDLYMLKKKWER